MTVGELINKLQKYDPSITIVTYAWQNEHDDWAITNDIEEADILTLGVFNPEPDESILDKSGEEAYLFAKFMECEPGESAANALLIS
jgi:hypothetical protein